MSFNKRTKSRIISILLILLLVLATGCQAEAPPETPEEPEVNAPLVINMGGGPVGAATEVLYTMMLEDFTTSIENCTGGQTTGAPAPNLMGLKEGKYNLVHTISDVTAAAQAGQAMFQESGPIEGVVNLITISEHTSTWIVKASSPYNSIEDLKGKSFSPGPRGTSNDIATQRLLAEIGLSYDDFKVEFLNFADAEQQMLDGHLDAMLFSFTTYPHPSLLSVIAKEQVRFLPVPEEAISGVVSKYGGVKATVLPEGVYTLFDGTKNPAIKGIGGNLHLAVKADMSEEDAYNMVKVFAENFASYQETVASLKKMKVEDMAKEIPGIEFHPGALKYYKEVGFIK